MIMIMKEIANNKYKHSELTGKIIGCAMKVHSTLGNGFQEVIYQRALAIEMGNQGLAFAREMEMPIFYDEIDIGSRRVDFFVEEKIMVELKALTKLENVHLSQALNYLEAYKMETGLLINFGSKSLEFKRVTNEQKLAKQLINEIKKSN
ncbi:MAG: GxxExxY protein [Flavobacteriales bacterium CG_4_10_14_0_2_um_filter_32_8]|nr:MAG: GxxExxY protein [Flavobacteriales bacterium CG_4_10_14_0_2_um_filter_32_8]PJB16425.1 MAG: GxxExxY protein [Flavobacteriales bacterium CG_4_9_14_3_um_filter_32_8]